MDLIQQNIETLGDGVIRPNETRNYTIINNDRVNYLASFGPASIPYLETYIKAPKTEDGLFEALCVVDKMADNKVQGLYKIYPALSVHNETDSPEIQVMLSGIYRKILVPDAFGPLCRMLNKQITSPAPKFFDPSEETGGAVLEYLKSFGAINAYSNPSVHPAAFKQVLNPPSPIPFNPNFYQNSNICPMRSVTPSYFAPYPPVFRF